MRRFVSMIIISGASAITFAVAGVPFNGKKGAALLEAVASSSRPSAVVQRHDLNFGMTDEFTGTAVEIKAGALPDGYEWGCLIPAEWWSNSWEVYGAAVSGDIYNIVPLCGDVRSYRRDLAPVESVVKPAYSNGLWSAGLTVLYGVETEAYVPPAALRGELARAFMYMAVVYHVATWTERAYMMMDVYAYPGLTDYAIPLLLDWHRANPPSVHEIAKNERGERLQGNRNPFVDYPELAEYLWGIHRDEQFVVDGEPMPLRGVYTLADARIDLFSSEVPADAAWTVNGIPVSSDFVVPAELGVGTHKFSYSSASTGERGIVMIKVERK